MKRKGTGTVMETWGGWCGSLRGEKGQIGDFIEKLTSSLTASFI